MQSPDEKSVMIDMSCAARNIVRFTRGMAKEEFLADRRTQAAIIYEIIILGEAAKRLPQLFREQHFDIPWAPMARMRDRLIHGYQNVNLDIVWATATESVPKVLAKIESLLPTPDA